MPEGPDGKTIIIVKKVSGHGGHHGGAWKVAYADFVTAMMALFMVLWLVNTASVTTRERIASYFQRTGVFDSGSGTPLEMGGGGILNDTFGPPSEENSQTIPSKNIYKVDTDGGPLKEGFAKSGISGAGQGTSEEELANAKALEREEAGLATAADEITKSLDQGGTGGGLGAFLGEVDIKIDQRGLHIDISDTNKASMFLVGSASIQGEAEQELKKIAQALARLRNPIDIEGHTDATPFRSTKALQYDNWNLSSDRANAARRVLQEMGVKDWQINRVVGYAAQRPKLPEDPLNPVNRRITISMRYTEQAAQALTGRISSETSGPPLVEKPKNPEKPAEKSIESLGANATETKAPTKEERITSSGLSVEVGTHLPEGAVHSENQDSNRPVWIEKDKIFGDGNPFVP